jgi:HK97 family phage portal protein
VQALGRILARDGFDDRWYGVTTTTTSGQTVDMTSSIGWSALYAAVTYVSEDVAKVPFGMYERIPRGKRDAPEHWLHEKLHDQPNGIQTAIEWREMMTAWSIMRGIAFSEARGTGRSMEIVPLHPDLIRRDTSASGSLRYIYRDPLLRMRERTILSEDLVILRWRLGRGVVDIGRETIALSLAVQHHAGTLFSRGARFQGVVSRPKEAPLWAGPEREAFRQALSEYASTGPRAGQPLLLEDGMTWENSSMTSQESGLMEQMRFGVAEASRLVRIPPHKLFELERSTFSNIDRQSIDYVVDSLLGPVKRWEQAVRRDLLSPVERTRFFAEHILDGLMRGDPLARSQAYAIAVQWGWLTRNEVRDKENLNALNGLDEPLTPLNMSTDAEGKSKVINFAPIGDRMAVINHLRLLASDAASRIIRKEQAAMARLAERTGTDTAAFRAGVDTFYDTHGREVAETLHIPEPEARRYARSQRAALLADGPSAMDDWIVDRADYLAKLARNQPELATAA